MELGLDVHHPIEDRLSPLRNRTADSFELHAQRGPTNRERQQKQPNQPRTPHRLKSPITRSDTSGRESVYLVRKALLLGVSAWLGPADRIWTPEILAAGQPQKTA